MEEKKGKGGRAGGLDKEGWRMRGWKRKEMEEEGSGGEEKEVEEKRRR